MVIPKKQKSPWIKYIKIKAMDILGKDFRGNSPPTIFVGSKHINDKKANVGDSVYLDLSGKIKKHISPEKGREVFIISGRYEGQHGKIVNIQDRKISVKFKENSSVLGLGNLILL